MASGDLPPPGPRLVWVYGESLTRKLDVATWLQTSSELCNLGWRVTLVATGPVGMRQIGKLEVVSFPRPNLYLLRQVLYYVRVLCYLVRSWSDTDVILFHQMAAPWVLILRPLRWLAGRRRPLLVMDTRDLSFSFPGLRSRLRIRFQWLAHRLANRWADGQTAITKRMAELVRIPEHQLWGVWPSGVDPALFRSAQAKRRWPVTGEPIQLAYVGILSPKRNPQVICEAVQQACAQDMDFVVTFVGDGPARSELERLALEAGERIRLLPPVPHDQVPQVLAKAHVGVSALWSPEDAKSQASSPVKLFEYMAAGLPLLAVRMACHTDFVGDAPYAFWIEQVDPAGALAALRQVWQKRDLLPGLGQQAADAVQRWTWLEAARKLKSALEHGLETH